MKSRKKTRKFGVHQVLDEHPPPLWSKIHKIFFLIFFASNFFRIKEHLINLSNNTDFIKGDLSLFSPMGRSKLLHLNIFKAFKKVKAALLNELASCDLPAQL